MRFSYELRGKSATIVGTVLGIIFLMVGTGLLIFGFKNINDYNKKDKIYIETKSTVVDYKEDWNDDQKMYAIIVQYYVDGVEYRKASNTYSTNPKSVGSEVIIKYNPENPTDIIWKNDISNIIFPAIGGVFAVVGLLITIISLVISKKEKTTSLDTNLDADDSLYESNTLNNIASNNQVELNNSNNNVL